jgi:hypothetical protein
MSHGASFVRVPPQSTGKRVATIARTQLTYDNQIANFIIGDTVTGTSSGATGTITSIVTENFDAGAGQLWLSDLVGIFQNNENLQVSGITKAAVNTDGFAINEYDYQNTVIVDPENPSHMQRIDRFGATVNTFTDGSPVFGAFGTLTVGEPQVIKDYRFAYNDKASDFWDQTSGGGTLSYATTTGTILFSCGTTLGDSVSRTTNFYHPYSPGVGHLVEMTMQLGDKGKANCRRRWGYYDDNDGVFFQVDGTDISVVVRSSTTGSVVDTVIPQESWSNDPLNGTDKIGFNLEVDTPNIYWMDLQWLGAGRIRFGVVDTRGSRIVAHVVENANTVGVLPYIKTATLPLRIEQENTGTTVSTSEMRWACAAIKHSSKVQVYGDKRTKKSNIKTIATASGEVPLMAIRPKTMFESVPNRGIIKGISVSYTNITTAGGSSGGPVLFRIRGGYDSAFTGEAFTSIGTTSITEADISASAINPALTTELSSFIVSADTTLFAQDISDRTLHTFEAFLGANGIDQPALIITAECLTGTDAIVIAAVNWEELKS